MASPAWHYVLKFIITGDAAVGKSSLLVRLTDQRFLANPDPTLGVEFGSKLITLPDPEATVVKLQCWDTAGTESFRSITRSYYRGAAGCLLVYDVTSRRSFDNLRTWLADVRAHADAHVSCILVGNKRDLWEGADADEDTGRAWSACAWRWHTSALPSSTVYSFEMVAAPASSVPRTWPDTVPRSPISLPLIASLLQISILTSTRPDPKPRAVPTEVAEQFAKEEGLLFTEASARSGEGVEEAFVRAAQEVLSKVREGRFDDERSPGVKLSKPGAAPTEETGKQQCCST
ncbi:Ras-domain-containing protein [Mycena venus]|uniref:Ras-domain-containing protein n=1 Tax=Mycena venus TaxID=2733690 RepID=A0A8H6XHM5_9AGAR|nr:Ras-domain-containing protein [Mycena venus]